MSTNNTSPPPQVTIGDDNVVVSPPTPPLDPPVAPVVATASAAQEAIPSSTRTSFTRVDHDEDDHRPRPSTSNDPVPPLPSVSAPTPSQDSAPDSRHPAVPLISTVSQDQQAHLSSSSTEPEMPATQPQAAVAVEEPVPQMPQTYLNFLLISGRRRTMSFEPETAIGRVKELVWNSWPADWQDERPPAPSYLRVLYLGRMLQDDDTLSKLKLPTHTPQPPTTSSAASAGPTPTIMHLSIRPYAPPNEGDAVKKKRRRGQDDASANNEPGDEAGGAGSCRCIIC